MADVDNMSDAELRTKLAEFGFGVMPITGTTRKVMVRKLKLLMENKTKSSGDGRRSLSRYSSEEESDSEATAKLKKNRRVTMAAPSTGSVRKSGRLLLNNGNDAEDLPPPTLPRERSREASTKRTSTTTTKTTVKTSVQDNYDTGSDSDPEVTAEYTLEGKKALPLSPPAAASSPYSPTRSSYVSASSGDALGNLNQIRSRLSLGNSGYVSPQTPPSSSVLKDDDKVETPFLSNFTRRLSALSAANSPKPEYGFKNDVIKEHDTNGAGHYARSYLGRSTRYRDYIREAYRPNDQQFARNNWVSLAIVGLVFLFFVVIGFMYLGLRSDGSALEATGYFVPYCVKSDPNAKKGINCVVDTDVLDAINLLRSVKVQLVERAIAHRCADETVKPFITDDEIVDHRRRTVGDDPETVHEQLRNLIVLVFNNPGWGVSVVRTSKNYVSHDDIFDSAELTIGSSKGLAVLNPPLSWRCTLVNKLYAVLNTLLCLFAGFAFVYAFNYGLKWYKWHEQRRRDDIANMVERIIEILQTNAAEGSEGFLVVNHVRDMILPIKERGHAEKTWEKAVAFINEKESRVRTEVQVVRGEPYDVWRWVGSASLNISGSPRNKIWQGQAFETQVGSVNSLPCSPTPCLKIRGMVDDNDRNFGSIVEAVLGKCAQQCRILHCTVDNVTKCVYLKCADQNDAAVAYRNLHGWWYAGHLVTVKYLRLERYMQRFPDSPATGPPYLKANSPASDWTS